MDANIFLNTLEKEFNNHSDPMIAEAQKAYMRNQFEFYGLTANQRRIIQKPLFKAYTSSINKKPQELIETLWMKKERDYQYCAQELIMKNTKQFKVEDITLFEFMIINKSWWDTIDFLAPKILGKYFKLYPEKIEPQIEKWLSSNNIWLKRSCLLFQLKYKQNLNTKLLTHIISSLVGSKEFFINKAIGWILREYSKTNQEWVCHFIKTKKLHKLSEKEGLKFIKNQQMR